MTDLKKCPFPSCGSTEIELMRQEIGDDFVISAYCHGCGCEGPCADTPEEAAEKWNTRTGLDREKVLELAAALKDYFDGQLDISESFKRGFRYGVDMIVGKIFDIESGQLDQE